MNSPEIPDGPVVIIYTQALCGYCAAACALLKSKAVEYEEINVTLDAERRREMAERAGRQTVPQIFIHGQYIGGYDDLVALDEAGQLDGLLGMVD